MTLAATTTQSVKLPQPPQAEAFSAAAFRRALTLFNRLPALDPARLRQSFVAKALHQRLAAGAATGYDSYLTALEQLPDDHPEWQHLIHELTVHDTWFFRHPPSLAYIQQLLTGEFSSLDQLRLWNVGCAYGEETWSIAITVAGSLKQQRRSIPWQILGSDISSRCLNKARTGIYRQTELKYLDDATRMQYFAHAGNGLLRVTGELKQHTCFTQANICDSVTPMNAAMHIVYCQNTLIYFSSSKKQRALDNLAAALNPGGVLLLAPGEAHGWSHPAMRNISPGNAQLELFQRMY